MKLRHLLVLLVVMSCAPAHDVRESRFATARPIDFTYSATVTGLEPGATARIWIPQARTGAHQNASILTSEIPGDVQHTSEPRFGNELIYTEATANAEGEIPLSVTYRVERVAAHAPEGALVTEDERTLFREGSSLVPVGATPVTNIAGQPADGESRTDAARRLYDAVDEHVTYDKPANGGWGRGDTLWVCDSRHGNCTDFHSLFIAMCRSEEIPAHFEIGFPIPADATSGTVGGYHCWAWFDDGERWVGVDISEADKHPSQRDMLFGTLEADRVGFTVGRDIDLVPQQAGDPINFFVHPHVEVDGEVHSEVSLAYSFAQPSES